jgi:hypothetical protein
VVDFYQCYADLSAETLLDFCRTVKAETGGEKLAGAFYGYLMELAWNLNYFVEIPNLAGSQVATTQRSGHLGLRKILRSPDIDFLLSPYGYAFRGVGGDGLPMQPSESLRLHGKLYLMEEDTTMHNSLDPNGRNQRVEHSIAVIQRNFAQVLTHGTGITWLDDSIFPQPAPIAEEAQRWIARFQALGRWSLQLDRTPQSQVAVLLDDESYYYQALYNNLDIPHLATAWWACRAWRSPRCTCSKTCWRGDYRITSCIYSSTPSTLTMAGGLPSSASCAEMARWRSGSMLRVASIPNPPAPARLACILTT